MLSNNKGNQALPHMISLALATKSHIFYRAEATWIYHNEQVWGWSFLETLGCSPQVKHLLMWEGKQPDLKN